VDGISFEIPQGSFFAFLGPNGAGKSTTIQILTSILKQDSGEATIFGKSPRDPESKRSIGVVFQDPKLDKSLTVRENLETRAALYGLKDAEMKDSVGLVMETTECTEFADRKYGELSGGQRRRVDIARALVHKPQLLILDEPTTGLHFADVHRLTEILRRLTEGGNTVVVIEHNLDVIKQADYIIDLGPDGGNGGGTVVVTGTPEEVAECKESYTGQYLKRMLR
jgi:multidrug/hemolysin transport system ATP-binding protein